VNHRNKKGVIQKFLNSIKDWVGIALKEIQDWEKTKPLDLIFYTEIINEILVCWNQLHPLLHNPGLCDF